MYCEAASQEELADETDDEELATASRGWWSAQQYNAHFSPGFMIGWADMLARWGCYLGWLTESEDRGIL